MLGAALGLASDFLAGGAAAGAPMAPDNIAAELSHNTNPVFANAFAVGSGASATSTPAVGAAPGAGGIPAVYVVAGAGLGLLLLVIALRK